LRIAAIQTFGTSCLCANFITGGEKFHPFFDSE
jgi:hypothetical protein